MKIALTTILLACVCALAQAQDEDTLKFFTKGDITNQVFSVQEIEVRHACECVGECTCENPTAKSYADDRFNTTDKILARSGRIDMIKRGNFAFEPILNGMGSDRMNLTIDGMKIFGACTDKMDPVTSYVEPNNLKNFTIHNGASGGKYGSSIAGSINMETAGATISSTKEWTGEVGAGFNSVANGIDGLLSINKSGEKWAINANGVYRKNDSYKAGGGEEVPFSYYEKWNGAFSGKYMPTDRDLISFDVIIDEGYNIGYPALPMDVGYAKARIYGLTYQRYPQSEFIDKLTFKAYANTVNHAMDDTKRPEVFMHMDMPGWTKTLGGFADAEMSLKKHKISARVDGYFNNSRAEMTMYPAEEAAMFMLTWPDVDKLNFGGYIQDQIQLTDLDLIRVNARLDILANTVRSQFGIDQASVFNQDLSGVDHRIMPSVSATYQRTLSRFVKAWITAGYTERAPSVTEQYAFYIFNAYDGFDYIGNVALKNEKALQGDLGMNLEPNQKLSLGASAFYYQMYDYILGKIDPDVLPMTHGSNGVKISENIDHALITGLSLLLTYQPIEKLDFSSQFSYSYGETGDGTPLPLMSPLKNMTSANYTISEFAYASFQVEAAAEQNRLNPDFGETASPAYALLHLRGGYTFKIKENSLSANGGIENLLDTKYNDHLDWGGIPRPGRNFYLNLSYSF
ncbi:hypothetical protein G3O08_03715 [Cryomorpha ignava]|uniref:TonB-dependent receptor plug domain-containing protein n=1 Tax=Cryomorpha ignava TaxID=101383 RepID=A0A7K3WNN1_9FLAO|nr:TonB-dependent receptor plug domain-containing protein [Cryomorpha ignava]NEN22611.1 hypothetical protein [Cryomorpha ignava]